MQATTPAAHPPPAIPAPESPLRVYVHANTRHINLRNKQRQQAIPKPDIQNPPAAPLGRPPIHNLLEESELPNQRTL